MKKYIATVLCVAFCLMSLGCQTENDSTPPTPAPSSQISTYEGTHITLSDNGITVDGQSASADPAAAVYIANDIIYYQAGNDHTYGEGDTNDAHSPQEAQAHTVVHITQAGQYVLSGTLSKGQIAIDLGDEAKNNPEAVVTLVLNGANITCSVAPAVIFYNVYECGNTDADTATATVDTTTAGANLILAKGSENNIVGAYVAKIYKPESVELNEDGTEVVEAKKLHKYDGAFYSKMSMNIDGEGTLNIQAANEGLGSELHLTINGGTINIISGNDGINTNEDYVSVTTINGGNLNIWVNGATGEGDGIDSNGWLVINDGAVIAQACGFSGDAGIDSDKGIHINGGTVFATGNMLDQISESQQTFAVFQFSDTQRISKYAEEYRTFTLKDGNDNFVISSTVINDFNCLVVSTPALISGEYSFWQGDTQLSGAKTAGMGGGMGPGGMPPGGMEFEGTPQPLNPDGSDFVIIPGTITNENGEPITIDPDSIGDLPTIEATPIPDSGLEVIPFNPNGQHGSFGGSFAITVSTVFTIEQGCNYFVNVQ